MSQKSDYSPTEWQLLIDVPSMVGTAVMMAGKSGLGSMKEAFAVASGILGARDGYEDNELIQSLVEARTKEGAKSSIEGVTNNPYHGMDPIALADEVAVKCGEAAELLREKSTLEVGEKVANAAKEGGFLGIGGDRVSEEEKQVLEKFQAALA